MHKGEKANLECALNQRDPKERQKGLSQCRQFLPNFYDLINYLALCMQQESRCAWTAHSWPQQGQHALSSLAAQ